MNIPEKSYYKAEDGVEVTATRFKVASTIYPINTISSVSIKEIAGKRFGATMTVIVGLITTLYGTNDWAITNVLLVATGIALTIGGAIYWMGAGKSFALVISSSSGEARAVQYKDRARVLEIQDAISQAIINRG